MKKTLALILTGVLLALSLVSCGSKTNDYINYMKTDLSSYVTAGEYLNLDIELPKLDPVDDAAVDAAIRAALEGHAATETVDRAAEMGDTVNIDYIGRIDGVEFEGGSNAGDEIVLGDGGMIDGFEAGIVGMSAGETKIVDATFPEDYGKDELNGKTAQFEITLNSVSASVTPELTDEFVKELASDDHGHIDSEEPVETVEAYREYIRAELVETYEETMRSNKYLYGWTAVVNNCTVSAYPEKAVKAMASDLYDYYSTLYYQYQQYGLTLENLGITKDGCTEQARDVIKEELSLYAIVKAGGYTITGEEFNAKLNSLVEQYNASLSDGQPAMTAESYLKSTTRQSIETKIYYDKVMADVLASATFTEAAE